MDEMWSFVHDKSRQYWLWWAVDHHTGRPLAYCFGTREHKHLDVLRALLAPFNIEKLYSQGQRIVVKLGHGRKGAQVVPERLNRSTVGRNSATVYGDAAVHVEQAGIDRCSTVFGGFGV